MKHNGPTTESRADGENRISARALSQFKPSDGQPMMKAVVTLGNGGYDQPLHFGVVGFCS
jgi:hypothetical protein